MTNLSSQQQTNEHNQSHQRKRQLPLTSLFENKSNIQIGVPFFSWEPRSERCDMTNIRTITLFALRKRTDSDYPV